MQHHLDKCLHKDKLTMEGPQQTDKHMLRRSSVTLTSACFSLFCMCCSCCLSVCRSAACCRASLSSTCTLSS